MHEVARLHGVRLVGEPIWTHNKSSNGKYDVVESHNNTELKSPLAILQAQTSCTEVRGGQAGGFSVMEFKFDQTPSKNLVTESTHHLLSKNHIPTLAPTTNRVRCVAKKRCPLAADLAALYLREAGREPDSQSTVSVIGHTRFATSSINTPFELHPHEWVPFHTELIWKFNTSRGVFERISSSVGIHITHNGDFDALEVYSGKMVVGEVGLWLERVLHTPNNTQGDSPKIAGCMDLLRVQGRWGPSARLAWVRCVLSSSRDVSASQPLSKSAPNSFPTEDFFQKWGKVFESFWIQHMNNIVKPSLVSTSSQQRRYHYSLDMASESLFVQTVVGNLFPEYLPPKETDSEDESDLNQPPPEATHPFNRDSLGASHWTKEQAFSFISTTIRCFLRSDLYTALTEFLSRAEGSFGLQTHCTLEPGVVLIGSKGQPMSIAFDPLRPICLFASEAEALAVPVDHSGKWLTERIDLDPRGEIVRLGEARALEEGSFSCHENTLPTPSSTSNLRRERERALSILDGGWQMAASTSFGLLDEISTQFPENPSSDNLNSSSHDNLSVPNCRFQHISGVTVLPAGSSRTRAVIQGTKLHVSNNVTRCLQLESGLEIRCYSLVSSGEATLISLLERCIPIMTAPIPYDPKVDLVAADLAVTPALIATIDKAWQSSSSVEVAAGTSLAENLVGCIRRRLVMDLNTIDLLIGGVEASLWIAEQWAADLRRIFPQLNVVTISANKSYRESSSFLPYSSYLSIRLLGLNSDNPNKVFFPGSDSVSARQIDSNTCALLISQSGQTFPTLHATRVVSALVKDRMWILTGCFKSKMEQTMMEGYKQRNQIYPGNRVFNNYSGNRPAEPSSVAVAATWHSLTRLMLLIIKQTREKFPSGRVIHPWLYQKSARILQSSLKRYLNRQRRRKTPLFTASLPSPDSSIGLDIENTSGKQYHTPSGIRSRVSFHSSVDLDSQIDNIDNNSSIRSFSKAGRSTKVVMLLSDGCVKDLELLLSENLIRNLSSIVGYDLEGNPLVPKPGLSLPHDRLVAQGRAWGGYVNEPWKMLVLASTYIILSVGLGLPIFGLIGDAIAAIVCAGLGIKAGELVFTPRFPSLMYHQNPAWTVLGLVLQLADAVLYVYLIKMLTWFFRWTQGIPLWARHGKRTLVIVDSPCLHQLLETFVSKLYSQSYSFCSIEVHGASGLDHFVHRFTHRVTRGLLLAVGRPDGRMCCLAKSESAALLAAKQAAFIQNVSYPNNGNGPEIVTLGHNPYAPNTGLGRHISLQSLYRDPSDPLKPQQTVQDRRPTLDEAIFEASISSQASESPQSICKALLESREKSRNRTTFTSLPYGTHHLDPTFISPSHQPTSLPSSTHLLDRIQSVTSRRSSLENKDWDPAVRLAFFGSLDSPTQQAMHLQVVVQQFYESRVAALERYLAFCVLFHAMAAASRSPWFHVPWDVARSQSNLRIATTASPVAAEPSTGAHSSSPETERLARKLFRKLKFFQTNF